MRQGAGGAAAGDDEGARRLMAPGLTTTAARGGPVAAADERSTVTCRRPANGQQRSSWNDDDYDDDVTDLAKSRFMNSRAKAHQAYVPTDIEHFANVVTHALWIAPSVAGLWWMTSVSAGTIQQISALIYGLSLFFLFTVSTTFHALAYSGRFRELQNVFHIGDRAAIYIFIASSYTPWLALKDYHRCGLLTLLVVWIAAMLGILYQYSYHERYKWLETLLYIVIGVAPSVIIFEMKEVSGLHELAAGGIVYVVGVVFFKCDGVIPFAHAIWHSFVFVGATVHFVAVCRHLLGPSAAAVATDTLPTNVE